MAVTTYTSKFYEMYRVAQQWIGFPPLYLFLAIPTLYLVISTILMNKKLPFDNVTKQIIPAVGKPKILPWLFPASRAQIASLLKTQDWVTQGYEQHNRDGIPFMIYSTDGVINVLPRKYMNEVKNEDHHDLASHLPQSLVADITMSPAIVDNVYHAGVIRKTLTGKLNSLTPDIAEEVDISMRRFFDKQINSNDPKAWNKVNIFSAILKVVAQSSLRIFVGKLARDEGFQDNCISYATSMFPEAMVLKMFPKAVQHIIAPVVCFNSRRRVTRLRTYLRPLITQRIEDINNGLPEAEQPNDFLQWLIQEVPNQSKTEQNVDALALRLIIVSFAALHTTAMSMTNFIYDLAYLSGKAEPGEKTITEILREEVLAVLPYPHEFDKRMMQKLYNMDAFMKETLRLHMTTSISFFRHVDNPKGWTTSDGRFHFPYGALVSLPNVSMHLDADVYENPEKHDYTRFYRGNLQDETILPSQQGETEPTDEKPEKISGTGKQLDRYIVSTSNEYLVFGHGRHACPGRFFAANEMRIILSYFLIHYEVKPVSVRPPDSFINYIRMVDMSAILEIRKRPTES